MKKVFMLLIFAALGLTFACSAMAYTIEIRTGNIKYTGRSLAGDIEYRMDGKIVGYAKNRGGSLIYTDAQSKQIGSIDKVGNSWQFRGPDSTIIGYVESLGGRHIYKGGNSIIIGYAEKMGSRTEYKAGDNIVIGSADTTDMPFRPIPLERHLKKLMAAINANAVCLTRVTRVNPDSPAEKAGLQPNDFLIALEGKGWSIFDLLHSNYQTMHTNLRGKMEASQDVEAVMIVYRPAPNESNQAKGKIVQIALPAGKRGYRYVTAANCPFYSREQSKVYAEQIKQIYQRWQESHQ